MKSLLIETTQTHKHEVKIPVPSFWKNPNHNQYLAVLDEKTAVSIYSNSDGDYISIQHTTPQDSKSKIIEARNDWTLASEQEFFNAYDDFREATRLTPMIIDTGREEAYQDLMRAQNV